MKDIKKVTVEYEDGKTETWEGHGSCHEYQTGPRTTPPAHTSSYVNVVLVPSAPPKRTKAPEVIQDEVQEAVSHAEGIGDGEG